MLIMNNPELTLAVAKERQAELERQAAVARMLEQAGRQQSWQFAIQSIWGQLVSIMRSMMEWFRGEAQPQFDPAKEGGH